MKKFFSSQKNGPSKPVYRHTWTRDEEDEFKVDTSTTTSTGVDDVATMAPPPRISPDKRKEPSSAPTEQRHIFKSKFSRMALSSNGGGAASEKAVVQNEDRQVRCSRSEKDYYTVVRNVKDARKCHEWGETQEIIADIDYLLSTVVDSDDHRVKCLSVIKIATKCQSAQFRAQLRARGASGKLFAATADAAKYPSLAICTACVIYLLARDRLGIIIDQATQELLLRLIKLPANDGRKSVDQETNNDTASKKTSQPSTTTANDDEEDYENYRNRVWKILNEWRQQSEASAASLVSSGGSSQTNSQTLSIDDGGGESLAPTAMMFDITLGNLSARFLAIEALTFICCRTHDENFRKWMRESRGLHCIAQNLIKEADSLFSIDVNSKDYGKLAGENLKMLERYVRIMEHTSFMHQQNQQYLVVWESSSLVTTCARLFKHVISLIAKTDVPENREPRDINGLPTKSIITLLMAILKALLSLSHENVLCCTKLGGYDRLIADCVDFVVLTIPSTFQPATGFDLLILSLGLLINLVENCNANRRVTIDCVAGNGEKAMTALTKLFLQHELEARKTDDEVQKVIEDAQKLHDRSDGSQPTQAEVTNTLNAALKQANKNMEDSILASNVALLLGLVLQQNENVADVIKSVMPDGKLQPLVDMLQKFLDFVRLTQTAGRAGEKTISKAMEAFEHLSY